METQLLMVIKKHKSFRKRSQPHPKLLKSRLLFDGGYHQKALKSLKKIDNPMLFLIAIISLNTSTEKVEFMMKCKTLA